MELQKSMIEIFRPETLITLRKMSEKNNINSYLSVDYLDRILIIKILEQLSSESLKKALKNKELGIFTIKKDHNNGLKDQAVLNDFLSDIEIAGATELMTFSSEEYFYILVYKKEADVPNIVANIMSKIPNKLKAKFRYPLTYRYSQSILNELKSKLSFY